MSRILNLSKIKTGKISAIRFSTLNAICDVLDCQPGGILEFIKDDKTQGGEPNDFDTNISYKHSKTFSTRMRILLFLALFMTGLISTVGIIQIVGPLCSDDWLAVPGIFRFVSASSRLSFFWN